jgi:hypothetical protein
LVLLFRGLFLFDFHSTSESESESRLDSLADFLRTSGDLTVGGVAFLGVFW